MRSIRPVRRLAVAACFLLVVFGLAACSGGSGGSGASGGSGGSGTTNTQLTVFAASSLTEAFDRLATAFEHAHPGVKVVVSYDSSTTLADQIVQGAPADVIATADGTSMSAVTAKHLLAGRPTKFATNTLVVATPRNNPAHVTSVRDLQHAFYVVCDPSAPCGAAAREILRKAGVTNSPRSFEPDVKSVLSKLSLGVADAGLVYVSDATTAGNQIDSFPIPATLNVVNPYFIGVVAASSHRQLAAQWVHLVTSAAGQAVLRKDGFGRP